MTSEWKFGHAASNKAEGIITSLTQFSVKTAPPALFHALETAVSTPFHELLDLRVLQ